MYYYKVYGLNIESEILIPELTVLNEDEKNCIDIKLLYGTMNDDIKRAIKEDSISKYEYQDMWFHIKDVATYHIYNGDTIVIEPEDNSDFQLLKAYILGSVLGMALLQKNIVAIHGAAIVIDGKGCIFTGNKGAGKSTLTTALRQRGYKFVTDDVASINIQDTHMINPGFGYQKLCEDSMEKLGYDTSQFIPFRSDINIKYIVPALDSFVNKEVPLEALFELNVGDIDKIEIVEVSGIDKINNLIKNIFRIEMLYYSGGVNSEYLKKCVEIAKHIKFYRITRPKDIFSVNEQINIIEELMH